MALLVEEDRRQRQDYNVQQDRRFYRVVEAIAALAGAFGGRRVTLQPEQVFPSLRQTQQTERGEDVDPEVAYAQIRTILEQTSQITK